MPFPPDNPPHVFSVLAGREVSTWSEEWKHECEVRFLAGLPIAKRNEVFDEPQKGMKFKLSDAAVVHLRAEIKRYGMLKSKP